MTLRLPHLCRAPLLAGALLLCQAVPPRAAERPAPGNVSAPAAAAAAPLSCRQALLALEQQQRRLAADAPALAVLLLGEIHTSAADHAWQLRSLETLRQASRPLSLGLEMLPAARQPLLDRYASGQLEEGAFLQQVGWAEVWGHDPELYLPLLRWARRWRVPLLALNAEPELVRRVRRLGLAAVPPSQREGIGDPAAAGAVYRQVLRTAWIGHGGSGPALAGVDPRAAEPALSPAQAADLERFIDSQLLRDRAMAERLAAAHARQPERLQVALVGRGHLVAGDGIPAQLRDLGVMRQQALLRPPLPPDCMAPPPGARLGAYLESADGAVWVRRVAPGSAAEAAGLRPGDRILLLNDRPVQRAGEVILRVAGHPAADPITLTIERAGRRLRLRVRLKPAAPAAAPPPRSERAQATTTPAARMAAESDHTSTTS